jgi:hypothetical protein
VPSSVKSKSSLYSILRRREGNSSRAKPGRTATGGPNVSQLREGRVLLDGVDEGPEEDGRRKTGSGDGGLSRLIRERGRPSSSGKSKGVTWVADAFLGGNR